MASDDDPPSPLALAAAAATVPWPTLTQLGEMTRTDTPAERLPSCAGPMASAVNWYASLRLDAPLCSPCCARAYVYCRKVSMLAASGVAEA